MLWFVPEVLLSECPVVLVVPQLYPYPRELPVELLELTPAINPILAPILLLVFTPILTECVFVMASLVLSVSERDCISPFVSALFSPIWN